MSKTYFSESHEYAIVDGNVATIGITDFAQKALGNVVYVDLPEEGDNIEAGEDFGGIESVKAASDLIAPVSGEATEVNDTLADDPGLVNRDPMGAGWIVKVEMVNPAELDDLMDEAAYAKFCETCH